MAKNVEVKFDLKNTKKVTKNIIGLDKTIGQAGLILRQELIDNWNTNKGGDDRKLKALTTKYRKFKAKNAGGRTQRDLFLSGNMQKAFQVGKDGKYAVKLGYVDTDNAAKAKGNYRLTPSFMKIGKRLRTMILKFTNTRLFK